jgi:hypothetical protein
MRMAARRKRSWLVIGGSTAAIAMSVWGAAAMGALTGLSATSPTHVAAQLTWSDGAAATGYDVERSPGMCPGTFTAPPLVTGIPDTSFTDSLQPDGAYCYRVTGHYATTPDSVMTKDVRLDTTPPTAPVISFSPPPSGSALQGTVTIVPSSSDPGGADATGVASYVISVDGGGPLPGTQWDTTLGSDGTHTLHATAIDGAGNASPTTTMQVAVKNSLPAPPAVSAQSPVAGRPTLTWPTALGESYDILRDGSFKAGNLTAGQWTDQDALPPGTYVYVVTATDAANHTTSSAPVSVTVIPPDVTAPRSVSANSPTSTVPHVTWEPPVTFAVLNWRVFRDGVVVAPALPAAASSFDDATLTAQGPHMYVVQAVNGATSGVASSPVSVTYDSMPPALASATATALPDGSISVDWPAAIDPSPGSGLATYVVRRGTTPPADMSSGTAVCTLTAPDTGCVDRATTNGTFYGYSVFAVDGAGNFDRREASAKASDTVAPDAVTGLKVASFDFSYARLVWNVPALTGANADLAGYRVVQLRRGAKAPLNPQDGTVVCRDVDPGNARCDVLNLERGKKVTFAVYAFDAVPNYSAPRLISMVPHSVDHTPPHKPTKVRLTHSRLNYLLTWKSPRDIDLSKFRVTLYDKKPPTRPSLGRAVVTGRVLHASFTLKPGRKVYVTLFALDVSGNFSRVTKLVVAPGTIVTRSKHKVVKKAAAKKKTAPKKKTVPKKKKTVPVTIN